MPDRGFPTTEVRPRAARRKTPARLFDLQTNGGRPPALAFGLTGAFPSLVDGGVNAIEQEYRPLFRLVEQQHLLARLDCGVVFSRCEGRLGFGEVAGNLLRAFLDEVAV